MADAIQDKNNPNIWREGDITIIKIPELGEKAEMRFRFPEAHIELAGHISPEDIAKANKAESRRSVSDSIDTPKSILDKMKLNGLTSVGSDRAETETILEEMFNHPKASEAKLQHDLNQLIVDTYNQNKDASGKPIPIDIGKSNDLTKDQLGGALQEKSNGQAALAINLEAMKKSEYIYVDTENGRDVNKNHPASIVDIFRHELFHYVDTHMQGKDNGPKEEKDGEARAVWYVNQFQSARGEPKRASYAVSDNPENVGQNHILPELVGEKMPQGDAPSHGNLRVYKPIATEGKEHKPEQPLQSKPQSQNQSSSDTQLLPGLAGFATASELFLSERSGLSPANQKDVKAYVDSLLAKHNTTGKDIVVSISDTSGVKNAVEKELTLNT
ncbi:MAG: hypothetical protein HOP26_01055 [Methylotenera sp.]|nr:hypothetical protein [Methylotenera sp.]